jgi:hypothetical protein
MKHVHAGEGSRAGLNQTTDPLRHPAHWVSL